MVMARAASLPTRSSDGVYQASKASLATISGFPRNKRKSPLRSYNEHTRDHCGKGSGRRFIHYGPLPIPKLYGSALVAAAQRDPRIVCLTADLTAHMEVDLFRDALPDRFFQVGIAEANMIGIAGGMARMGDIPFIH